MQNVNLINNKELGGELHSNFGGDYAASWYESKAPEGSIVLSSHFNEGDWLLIAEAGWKLRAVVLGTCQWASTVPQRRAIILEEGDVILAGTGVHNNNGITKDVALALCQVNGHVRPDGKPLMELKKIAQWRGDTPLLRKIHLMIL